MGGWSERKGVSTRRRRRRCRPEDTESFNVSYRPRVFTGSPSCRHLAHRKLYRTHPTGTLNPTTSSSDPRFSTPYCELDPPPSKVQVSAPPIPVLDPRPNLSPGPTWSILPSLPTKDRECTSQKLRCPVLVGDYPTSLLSEQDPSPDVTIPNLTPLRPLPLDNPNDTTGPPFNSPRPRVTSPLTSVFRTPRTSPSCPDLLSLVPPPLPLCGTGARSTMGVSLRVGRV